MVLFFVKRAKDSCHCGRFYLTHKTCTVFRSQEFAHSPEVSADSRIKIIFDTIVGPKIATTIPSRHLLSYLSPSVAIGLVEVEKEFLLVLGPALLGDGGVYVVKPP